MNLEVPTQSVMEDLFHFEPNLGALIHLEGLELAHHQVPAPMTRLRSHVLFNLFLKPIMPTTRLKERSTPSVGTDFSSGPPPIAMAGLPERSPGARMRFHAPSPSFCAYCGTLETCPPLARSESHRCGPSSHRA